MTAPRALLLILGGVLVGILAIAALQRPDLAQEPADEFRTEAGRLRELPRIEMYEARFSLCDGPVRANCVIDGDTFWFKGDKIRIADIDAPEIVSPRCRDERRAGELARDRLLVLLNAGSFSLTSGWRDTDRYGRKLRTVTRDGRSIGEMLVTDGLARRWNEARRDWCAMD